MYEAKLLADSCEYRGCPPFFSARLSSSRFSSSVSARRLFCVNWLNGVSPTFLMACLTSSGTFHARYPFQYRDCCSTSFGQFISASQNSACLLAIIRVFPQRCARIVTQFPVLNLRWRNVGDTPINLPDSKTGPRSVLFGKGVRTIIDTLPGTRHPDACLFPKHAHTAIAARHRCLLAHGLRGHEAQPGSAV